MGYLNDWHDYLRVVVFFVSLYSLYKLIRIRRREGVAWNTKTNDYWFAMLMWVLAGHALTLQGFLLDRPFTPAFAFLSAAVLTTAKGLHQKGAWGG